jgi:hypothetical protein
VNRILLISWILVLIAFIFTCSTKGNANEKLIPPETSTKGLQTAEKSLLAS